MPDNQQSLSIHVIADSSGETAARLARAAQAQFPQTHFSIVRHPRVKDADALLRVFDRITAAHTDDPKLPIVILFTLVKQEMAGMVKRYCDDKQLHCADLMSETLRAIGQTTGSEADEVVMRPVAVEADYFDRISAMEFAVRNDDGIMPTALGECDICLVGASRSGKTPLSLYLGYVGYKTVNVPLVPGIKPPDELFQIDRWRIVGLTIDAERLLQIRSRRVRTLGGYGTKDGGYADLAKIYDELDEVGRIQRQLGCPVIDTTGLALEEAAARVTDIVEERARKAGARLRQVPGSLRLKP
ncbi:pyruvate, water dikinase regulatory protein [Propionimicrobium sp. PCR01-08-3]|uniref:pyruvate, water dikinase regulatory protein n=1 Tax=Propionimicrobium sp. PCR01-08-3 TaxID=3052086 RepID=UPI00255C9878|nr:pyruvate, water dikinase regulatory protein [Propionimicrobium sp. PCR01-08-3]WIY82825.1 pyruvate, water dikinase regulatory protein [Propionimicrobium sp. PCR01-08-3]